MTNFAGVDFLRLEERLARDTVRVLGNQMVELQAVSSKLCDRATRIVMGVAGVERPAAEASLEASGWSLPRAITRLGR